MLIIVENNEDASLLDTKMNDNNMCIVFYYMNGCFYCEQMKEEWNKFETQYSNNPTCTIGKVEAQNMDLLVNKPEINGYPTISKYINGKREDFTEDRTLENLIKFGNILKHDKTNNNTQPQIQELFNHLKKKGKKPKRANSTGKSKRANSTKKTKRTKSSGKSKRAKSSGKSKRANSTKKTKRDKLSRKSKRGNSTKKTKRAKSKRGKSSGKSN